MGGASQKRKNRYKNRLRRETDAKENKKNVFPPSMERVNVPPGLIAGGCSLSGLGAHLGPPFPRRYPPVMSSTNYIACLFQLKQLLFFFLFTSYFDFSGRLGVGSRGTAKPILTIVGRLRYISWIRCEINLKPPRLGSNSELLHC